MEAQAGAKSSAEARAKAESSAKAEAEAKAVKNPRNVIAPETISAEVQRAIDDIKASGVKSIMDVLAGLGERKLLSSKSKRPAIVFLTYYGFSRKEVMEMMRVSAAYYAKCVSRRL